MRHSAGKNTRLKRQVSQLRHTVTTLRISKAASNDSGGNITENDIPAGLIRDEMVTDRMPITQFGSIEDRL